MTRRAVLASFAAFVSGVVFASGLIIGGMTLPKKVIGFLDVAGDWDPSLICVMAGAIAVYAPFYRWIARRHRPVLDTQLYLPAKGKIDGQLVLGATLFGVGWGLVGLCPGPAVTALATGASKALVFFAAMFGGMVLVRIRNTMRLNGN